MKLTLGQVREALQLPQETLRYWRGALLPLAVRKGHQPCFSPGDLLALAIVKILVDQFGVQIRNLDSLARALFDECEQHSWTRFERQVAVIYPGTWNLLFAAENQIPQLTGAAIIVPCGPVIAALRAALMVEQTEEPQGALRFPLAAVERRSVGGDKS